MGEVIGTVAQVAAEAEQLRELAEARIPGFAATRRDYAEAQGDPALVRAFWAALGWSDVLRGNDLAPPERAAGLARIDELLASYRSDSFTLNRADLPTRMRLVGADDAGVGFSITDEDRELDDPPVRIVLFDDDAVVDGSDSYVCWSANAVVRRAFASGTFATVRARGVPGGRQPFPCCSPLTAELADGVWSVPASPELRSPGDALRLSCTIDALVAWLERIAAYDIVLEHLGPTRTAMTDGDAPPVGFVPLGGFAGRAAWYGRDAEGTAIAIAWSPGRLLWHRGV